MISRLLKVEPVSLVGLGAAVETLLVLLGADKALLAAIGAVLVAAAAVARQLVAPIPHVVEMVKVAATESANATAESLGEETVGAVGRTTDAGLDVASRVAELAANGVLKDAGVKRKDRVA